jgi:peptide/nickel transport system permease protein
MATTADIGLTGPVLREHPGGLVTWPGAIMHFCRRKPLGAIGGAIVGLMIFCAIFVDLRVVGSERPLLAPSQYNEQNIRNINEGLSWSHPLGTDQLGRDIFSRILYGARIASIIGFVAVTIAAIVSLTLGTVSGYFGGWVDTIIQRLVDVILAIPPLILLVFALSVFTARSGPYYKMFWITGVIGILLAAASVRVVRSAALSTAANQYVDAARTIGASDMRIVFRHIVPNVAPVVIVLATVYLGTAILVAAAVSFLGLGIADPFPDWGTMLSISGSSQFRAHPVQAIWPGLAIAFAVYGFNVLGDALRDVLDPRLRGGR